MIKKIVNTAIVSLLLVATTGLTVNLHYCRENLYDIGVFSKAESCCMPGENKKPHRHCNVNNHQKSDCEDKTVNFEPVDNFVVSSSNFDFSNFSSLSLFILNSIVTDIFNYISISVIEIPKQDISPPEIQVVLSLLQTYLL